MTRRDDQFDGWSREQLVGTILKQREQIGKLICALSGGDGGRPAEGYGRRLADAGLSPYSTQADLAWRKAVEKWLERTGQRIDELVETVAKLCGGEERSDDDAEQRSWEAWRGGVHQRFEQLENMVHEICQSSSAVSLRIDELVEAVAKLGG